MIKILESAKSSDYSYRLPDLLLKVEWNPTKKESQIDSFRVAITNRMSMYVELDRKQQSYINTGTGSFYHATAHLTCIDGVWAITDNKAYISKAGSFSAYDTIPKTHREKLESLFLEIANTVYQQFPDLFFLAEIEDRKQAVERYQREAMQLEESLKVALDMLHTAEAKLDIAVLNYSRATAKTEQESNHEA